MRKVILSLVACLALTACSSTQPVKVVTTPIEKPALKLPPPSAVKLDKFTWIVITEDNLEEVIAQLKKTEGDVVLFALTPQGYQALSMNNKKMEIYLRQLQDQLNEYKKYYENGEKR